MCVIVIYSQLCYEFSITKCGILLHNLCRVSKINPVKWYSLTVQKNNFSPRGVDYKRPALQTEAHYPRTLEILLPCSSFSTESLNLVLLANYLSTFSWSTHLSSSCSLSSLSRSFFFYIFLLLKPPPIIFLIVHFPPLQNHLPLFKFVSPYRTSSPTRPTTAPSSSHNTLAETASPIDLQVRLELPQLHTPTYLMCLSWCW